MQLLHRYFRITGGAFQDNFSCSDYILKEVQQIRWILDFLSHIYSWLTTIEEVRTDIKCDCKAAGTNFDTILEYENT